ncbi:MAG: lytic murein transglycosylase [Actinomycetota bacterium]
MMSRSGSLTAMALSLVLATSACASAPGQQQAAMPATQPAPAQPEAGAPVAPVASSFAAFLQGVRAEATAKGIRAETVDTALAGVNHLDKVIELDRKQPEFTLTFDQYLSRVVNPDKVAKGRRMMAENAELLAQIERRYNVQARFVVALWGIETDYGRVTGGYPVVASLATLAYDGRRSAYFRGELMNALTILDQGHIAPARMIGSWAGAMGQCQFMPTTFVKFAQDWDGDGRRDIWTNRGDALASAANYLASEGWRGDQTWGRAVSLPAGFDARLIGLDTRKSLAEWSHLGVHGADGKALPHKDVQGSIVLADGKTGPAFLVYDNFRTIMKWNRSTFFALAAGHLADRIGAK